jgi:hypothetical protein
MAFTLIIYRSETCVEKNKNFSKLHAAETEFFKKCQRMYQIIQT